MSNERISRRLAAIEAKSAPLDGGNLKVLFRPRGLDAAGFASWEAERVAPLVAAGFAPLVVSFVSPDGVL